jgi:chromosome segregation ATPase
MAAYTDLGQYIMKLFDELIADSKNQLNEAQNSFCEEIPRRVSARSSVTVAQAERFVREMADRLVRINQDLLNQYAISIAKKARSESKKTSQSLSSNYEDLKQQLTKKDQEIEGLQAQSKSLEQRNKVLEQEKEETLRQCSELNNALVKLEQRLANANEEFTLQINTLNAEWEAKFQKNQEEWDSYVKLKLAEQEITTTSDAQETE